VTTSVPACNGQTSAKKLRPWKLTSALRLNCSRWSGQWRHVAKSYEFIESLERFLLDQQKNALPQAEESPLRDNLELSEPLRSAQ
jgi:hypothetical protein